VDTKWRLTYAPDTGSHARPFGGLPRGLGVPTNAMVRIRKGHAAPALGRAGVALRAAGRIMRTLGCAVVAVVALAAEAAPTAKAAAAEAATAAAAVVLTPAVVAAAALISAVVPSMAASCRCPSGAPQVPFRRLLLGYLSPLPPFGY